MAKTPTDIRSLSRSHTDKADVSETSYQNIASSLAWALLQIAKLQADGKQTEVENILRLVLEEQLRGDVQTWLSSMIQSEAEKTRILN